MEYGERVDIFNDLTDDDITFMQDDCKPDTPREYFMKCQNEYGNSIFIDIARTLMQSDKEYVMEMVRNLSRLLRYLFSAYEIEHSDFILSELSGDFPLTENVEIRDCGGFMYMTSNDELENDFPWSCMMFVYVNYPNMRIMQAEKFIIKMLNSIWLWKNYTKHNKQVFSDVVLYKSFINYVDYKQYWFTFPHLLFGYSKRNELRGIDLSDSRTIENWNQYYRIKEWFHSDDDNIIENCPKHC